MTTIAENNDSIKFKLKEKVHFTFIKCSEIVEENQVAECCPFCGSIAVACFEDCKFHRCLRCLMTWNFKYESNKKTKEERKDLR